MTPEEREATLHEIDRVLERGGFSPIEPPLTIAGIPFDVLRAYRAGPGFLDLVVVLDGTDNSPKQLQQSYWLIERIARALDQARSRRPLTAVILHDPDSARVPTEDFLRLARVLLVTDANRVADEVAPIMPMVLEPSNEVGRDPLEDLLDSYRGAPDSETTVPLVEAARLGPGRVEAVLGEWLDGAFTDRGESDGESPA